MLSKFRQLVHSKLMLVVIGLLVVGLAGMGLPNMFSSAAPRGMMSAGDRFVPKREIDRRVDSYLNSIKVSQEKPATKQDLARSGVIQQIIQGIASETALLSFADSHKIQATRFAVAEMVNNAPRFKNAVTGKFDEDALARFAAEQYTTVKELEADLKDGFTRDYIVNAVKTGVNVPNAMGKTWITSQSEQRAFSFVKIAKSDVESVSAPSDADIQTFYDEHKNAFSQPQRKAVSILSISPADFIGSVEIPESELRNMYDLRIKDFSSPETRTIREFSSSDRRLVQKVVDDLGAGSKLEEIQEANPELTVSTRMLTLAEVENEEYGKTIFGVSKGTHFGVLELNDGEWVGAIVDEVIAGEATPFDNVSSQIFKEMAAEEAENIFRKKEEEFYDVIGGGYGLEEAAETLELPLLSFQAIDVQGRSESGQLVGSVVYRPTSMEVLRNLNFEGEISGIQDDAAGGLYVMRLDSIKEEFVPELANIRELAIEGYKIYHESKAVDDLANTLLSKAIETSDLKGAAEELKLQFVKPDTNLTRRDAPEGISRAMAYQLLGANVGDYFIASEQDGSKSVLHLESVTNLEPEMLDLLAVSGKRAIAEGLEADIESAFVEAIVMEAKLEFNNAAISEYVQSLTDPQ